MKNTEFYPSRLDFVIKTLLDLKKTSTAYVRMDRSAVPKLFWVRPKAEFGEHASNNNQSLKQRMKKMLVWVILAVSC